MADKDIDSPPRHFLTFENLRTVLMVAISVIRLVKDLSKRV